MVFTCTRTEKSLMHHGIKGQHWGIRNGPPYPLDKNKIKMGGPFNKGAIPLSTNSKLYNSLFGINPKRIENNCKDTATVGACNAYGFNLKAEENSVHGNLHDLFEDKFGMYNTVKSMDTKSSNADEFSKQFYKNVTRNGYAKDGDVGVISVAYKPDNNNLSESLTGSKSVDAHAFNWALENNDVTFGCGQSSVPVDGRRFLESMDISKEIEYTKVTKDMAESISKHYKSK